MPSHTPSHAEALHQLATDWIALWQSEFAAMSADREAQEQFQALLAFWAATAGTMLAALLPSDGFPPGAGRPAPAPRPPPAAAAPDPRDAEIERLARLVAELERRLSNLERPA